MRGDKLWRLCAVFAMSAAFAVAEDDAPVRSVEAVRTETPPVIDGRLDDECWKNAAVLEDFRLNSNGAPAARQTGVSLLSDGKSIYFGITCHEPEPARLKANVLRRDGSVWNDDCVEIYIVAEPEKESYWHFIVNSKGVQYDETCDMQTGSDPRWNGAWRAKTAVEAASWQAEIEIPFQDIRLAEAPKRVEWRINVNRECHTGKSSEYSSWAGKGAFGDPFKFGVLKWK